MRTSTEASTYILGDDGRLRQDPLIEGNDFGIDWRLFFTEGGANLAVAVDHGCFTARVASSAEAILRNQGIKAALKMDCLTHQIIIGGVMKECLVFSLAIHKPLPRHLFYDKGVWQPSGVCRVFSFGAVWG